MGEVRYIISEASKKIDVEQHTLRYWEEEIGLTILRNEMGHRYYREEDVEMIKAIKELKEKGYQLRAIKMLLPELQRQTQLDENIMEPSQNIDTVVASEKSIGKIEQFKTILNQLIEDALHENNGVLEENLSEIITDRVVKEMDYLLRIKEEREEERFQRFDRTLREMQNSRGEYAATKSKMNIKKLSFFRKKGFL